MRKCCQISTDDHPLRIVDLFGFALVGQIISCLGSQSLFLAETEMLLSSDVGRINKSGHAAAHQMPAC